MASVIALDPLRWAMRSVPYRRTARASETANKYGTFLSFFFWHKTPLSVWGNMKRILARSRRPVALRKALDLLYRSISAVTCRRIYSTVETCRAVVHSFVVEDHAIDLNVAY